jgi:hypothetical protein
MRRFRTSFSTLADPAFADYIDDAQMLTQGVQLQYRNAGFNGRHTSGATSQVQWGKISIAAVYSCTRYLTSVSAQHRCVVVFPAGVDVHVRSPQSMINTSLTAAAGAPTCAYLLIHSLIRGGTSASLKHGLHDIARPRTTVYLLSTPWPRHPKPQHPRNS